MNSPSITVAYRLSPPRPSKARPDWFDAHQCLRTFVDALDLLDRSSIQFRTLLVLDRWNLPDWPEFECFDQIERIDIGHNSRSYMYCMDLIANDDSTHFLMAEDDYLWKKDSLKSCLSALGQLESVQFLSPLTLRLTSSKSFSRIFERRVARVLPKRLTWEAFEFGRRVTRPSFESKAVTVRGREWVTVAATTMTFGGVSSTLADDRETWRLACLGVSPKDSWGWAAVLHGRWVAIYANAVGSSLGSVLNVTSARELATLVRRRLVERRRRVLIEPVIPLALHCHGESLALDDEWRQLASPQT